jgi:ABC-type transport system substrate-binding protein
MFNLRKPPYDDAKFRAAIAEAVDTKTIIDKILLGLADPLGPGMVAGSAGWYDSKIAMVAFDAKKAKADLEAAGYKDANKDNTRELPDGKAFKMSIIVPVGQPYQDVGDAIVGNLAKVGIKAEVTPLAPDAFRNKQTVGDFDVVREAQAVMGAEQLFWWISLKPGTPVCAAVLEGRLVIGLSGNPAAAITNFDLLVRPLLDKLCGRARLGLRASEGVLDDPVLKTAGIDRYLRARVYRGADGEIHIDTGMAQRAGILSSMVLADAYAIVPAHSEPMPAGSRVRLLLQDYAEV